MSSIPKSVANEKLFSSHYIGERLKKTKVWEDSEDLKEAFDKITEIYENEKDDVGTYDESPLERNFIRPIFGILNPDFAVQVPLHGKIPDYMFFRNKKDRREALVKKDYRKAIAVGEAKSWELELDKKTPSGAVERKFQNPSYKIYWYLEEAALGWGILTNGRKWRLYNAETARKLDTYYEVDLVDLIERDDLENFKYFYLFFRKEAFIPDSSGKCFLDRVYEQSIIHAEEIGKNLKENVYEVLRILANGFFEWKGNNLEKNKETIKKVHDECLIFLYRILFIFYAKDQGMLSGDVPETYEVYDIESLIEEITNKLDRGVEISPYMNIYWGRLTSIFKLINEGSKGENIPEEKFKVPAYNGGLFNEEKHEFLRRNIIPDNRIAEVIDLLARVESEDSNKRVRVDYSDLSVRHLGSIYEGLLEYKLRVGEEDMIAVKQKGALIWKKKSEVERKKIYDKVQEGELYLVTDKGERKATGSYYTPDYIVKYIVENTLGPVLEEKLKNVKTDEEKREVILSTKILDPAMGSGHFLVEATDFLAHKLVEVIESEGTQQDIIKAKREIVKHCIYGVDINPLATELAKLSLWLHTLAEDKPLSFLSHHLKTGNSLIGVRLDRIAYHPEEEIEEEQKSLASFDTDIPSIKDDIRRLIEMYREIMDMPENRPEDIHEAEEIYHEFREQKRRKWFNLLADVYTSYCFGNTFSKTQYKRLMDIFQSYRDVEWDKIIKEDWIRKVTDSLPDYIREEDKSIEKLSTEKKFFHWELEFPEVFFDIERGDYKENPGFDAVIGNPPHGAKYDKLEKDYCNKKYTHINDSVSLFFDSSYEFSAIGGKIGLLFPKGVLLSNPYKPLRITLFSSQELVECLDFGRYFHDIELEFAGLLLEKRKKHKYLFLSVCTPTEYNSIKWDYTDILPIRRFICGVPRNDVKVLTLISKCGTKGRLVGYRGLPKRYISSDDESCISHENIYHYLIEEVPQCINTSSISKGMLIRQGKKRIIARRRMRRSTIPYSHSIVDATIEKGNILNFETVENISHTNSELKLEYIVSILNSKLIEWYINRAIYLFPKTTTDFDDEYLQDIPISFISSTTPKEEREKLVANLKQKYQNENFDEALKIVEGCLPKDKEGNFITEKEKSDVVHDFLAFLAEQMIEMNKKKNTEIKGFLKWLEIEVGTKIDDMRNKTVIKKYYNRDFETLIDILKKNKSKLQIDPSRRNFQEKVRAEFETSILKLKPLIARIGKTDWLIDQIVYKLYGLTDEEIKIVEGSVKN